MPRKSKSKVSFNSRIRVKPIPPNPKKEKYLEIPKAKKEIDYDSLAEKAYENSIKDFIKYVVDKYREQSRDPTNVITYNPNIFSRILEEYISVRPVHWQNDIKKKNEIYDEISDKVSSIIEKSNFLRDEVEKELERKLEKDIRDIKSYLLTADNDLRNIGKEIFKAFYIYDNDRRDMPLHNYIENAEVYKEDFEKALQKVTELVFEDGLLDIIRTTIPHEYTNYLEMDRELIPDLQILFNEIRGLPVDNNVTNDDLVDAEKLLRSPENRTKYWSIIAKDFNIVDPSTFLNKSLGGLLSAKTKARRFAGDIDPALAKDMVGYTKPVGKQNTTGSKATDDILLKYGNYIVKGINIVRSPVESFVQKVSNWLSAGEFNKLKGKYDEIYHLAGILELFNKDTGEYIYLKTERRPKIQWDKVSSFKEKGKNVQQMAVGIEDHQPTLNQLIANAIKTTYNSDRFDQYDPIFSNCQRYIQGLVNALYYSTTRKRLGLPTVPPQNITDFISQDVTDLAKKAPIFHKVGKFITDLAGKFQAGNLEVEEDDGEQAW